MKEFHKLKIKQVPREANEEADYLARVASTIPEKDPYRLVLINELDQPSYEILKHMQATATRAIIEKDEDNWQTQIVSSCPIFYPNLSLFNPDLVGFCKFGFFLGENLVKLPYSYFLNYKKILFNFSPKTVPTYAYFKLFIAPYYIL